MRQTKNKLLAYATGVFLALACTWLAPAPAFSQVGGTISGTMTDPSGAVVPGGHVSVKNIETRVTRTGVTNESGFYRVPNLEPGKYEIAASAAGFKTTVASGITLTVGAEQVVNLRMTLGEVAQAVDVTGGAVAVELASSMMSQVVGSGTIRELPLNGRDWTQLATLQPGVSVIYTQSTGDSSRTQRGNGVQMTISGGRPGENNYRLDGISINDYANTAPGSTLGINLGVDAIEEFSVLTSTYSADYGRASGGVINAVTRSGTNQLHGTAYYFHRNSALDARNFFDTTSSPPPFHRHQFGGSAGGPIQKDRTFWFADYEGFRESLGVTTISTVLSPAARTGSLNGGKTQVTVDPAVKPYLALWPLPNGPLLGNGDTGIFSFAGQRVSHENYVTGKGDHKFSDKDSLRGTYLFDNADVNVPDEFHQMEVLNNSRRQSSTLEETHIFSPQLLNSARIGFSRTVAVGGGSGAIFNPLLKDPSLGFVPGAFVGEIAVSGMTGFSGGLDSGKGNGPNAFHFTSYQAYDDLFLTKGIHSLKFGVVFERIDDNLTDGNNPSGRFQFGSITDFLTNRFIPNPAALTFDAQFPGTDTLRGIRESVFAGYIQDNIRWRRNLTLNLGLRWETTSALTEVNGKLAKLVHLTDKDSTVVKTLFGSPSHHNFAPRVGFAWDPSGTGKTAVRGGFGIFDVLPLPFLFTFVDRSPPFYIAGTTSALPPGSFPTGAFKLLGTGSLRTIFVPDNPPRAYKMQWNLNVQRELVHNLTATLGYVGARGVHLPQRSDNLDMVLPTVGPNGQLTWPPTATSRTINPNFSRVPAITWDADSYYHALQVSVRKLLSHGLQAQGSYTWAKSIDTSSVTFATPEFTTSIANPYPFDPALNRGLSDFDIRHDLVLNLIWEIPAPASWPGASKALLGGWQAGAIFTTTTGSPFTAILNSDRAGAKHPLTRQNLGERPDFVAAPGCHNPTNPGNPNLYIKAACFAFPPAGRMGTLGRNTLTGPGLMDLDFSVFKNTPVRRLSENFKVQFRAELFNVLNHANFALPSSSTYTIFDSRGNLINNPGQIFRTQDRPGARQIQFGLKFIW